MTILQCVAIRDVKVAFNRPFFAPSLGAALRAFTDEVNRQEPNNEMNRHPNDFSLYHLGHYNDEDGTLHPLPHPTQLAEASACLNPDQQILR